MIEHDHLLRTGNFLFFPRGPKNLYFRIINSLHLFAIVKVAYQRFVDERAEIPAGRVIVLLLRGALRIKIDRGSNFPVVFGVPGGGS
jgi:hypothetical protein